MPEAKTDYLAILRTLVEHQVDFIVVGGVCGVLHGAPLITLDLDVVHSRAPENLPRLLTALQALDAYYREQPARKIRPGLSHLASPGHSLLKTSAGPLDVLGTVGHDLAYENLQEHTVEEKVAEGLKVRILDLPTLIRIKEEAGRSKDKAALLILRRTLEEKAKAKGDSP